MSFELTAIKHGTDDVRITEGTLRRLGFVSEVKIKEVIDRQRTIVNGFKGKYMKMISKAVIQCCNNIKEDLGLSQKEDKK